MRDVKHGEPHQVHTPENNTNVTDSVSNSPVFRFENHFVRRARIENVWAKGPHKRLYMVEVQWSLQCPLLSILFYFICEMAKTVSMIPHVAIGYEIPAMKNSGCSRACNYKTVHKTFCRKSCMALKMISIR
jgi:hypothetical protein